MLRQQPPSVVHDSVTADFLRQLEAAGPPPVHLLSPPDARLVLESAQATADYTFDRAGESSTTLSVAGQIPIVIFRPPEAAGTKLLPATIYLHGGGWVLGSHRTHARLMRTLAMQSGAAVVYVDYSRSPEALFPRALEESFAVLHWLSEHGATQGIDSSRLAVAGDSAGGNLATYLAMMATARGAAAPLAQVLFYPVTDAAMESASYAEFANGPWLSRDAMKWFWDAYAPRGVDRTQHLVSPLLAPEELLSGQPPALVITAEADVLRDEGEAYAARLRGAGVEVRGLRYLGAIHDFAMLNALAGSAASREAAAQAGTFLSRRFAEPRTHAARVGVALGAGQ